MVAQAQQIGKPKNTRLPLMGAYSNRGSSGTKDQRFVNMFPETRKVDQLENTKIFINKRPGLVAHWTFPSGEGRGLAYFSGKFYAAIANKVYAYNGTTQTEVITMTTSTGNVGMLWANSATIGDYLFICDGVNAWTINTSGTVSMISNTMLHSVQLTAGGTGFTAGTYAATFTGGGGSGAAATYTVTGTAVTAVNITNYGTGYTSSPTISFPLGGGTGVTATVSLNAFPTPHVPVPTFIDGYVVLARANSVDVYTCDLDTPTLWSSTNFLSAEMFPDPVISLARQNNQVIVLGHNSIEFFYDAANASGSPLSRNDSTTIQMGTSIPYGLYQNEQFCAYVSHSDSGGRAVWVINGFQPKKVSDEYIERILDAEADLLSCRAFGLRTMGHLFYVINLVSSNRTLVYDMDEKLWHEWSSNSSGNHSVFECNYMADKSDGAAYMLHKSSGELFRLDPNSYKDVSKSILCELTTNRYDMDTYNRKFMSSVKIVGDRYDTTNTVNLQWTDNDYQSWSSLKPIDLTDDYPAFHRLGAFRRRAFKLTHTLDKPFRVESLECVYTEGMS